MTQPTDHRPLRATDAAAEYHPRRRPDDRGGTAMAAPMSERLTETRQELHNLRRGMANTEGLLRFARDDTALPGLVGEVVTVRHAIGRAPSAIVAALETDGDGRDVESLGLTGTPVDSVPPRRV